MAGPKYNRFSAKEFQELLAGELAIYYKCLNTTSERLFYFEGQDPFSGSLPSECMASMYWHLSSRAAWDNFVDAVKAIFEKPHEVSIKATGDLVSMIAEIHRPDLLVSMAHCVISQIPEQETFSNVSHAVSICMGMSNHPEAFEAYDVLKKSVHIASVGQHTITPYENGCPHCRQSASVFERLVDMK